VPEPSTLCLVAAGGLGWLLSRRLGDKLGYKRW